MDAVGPIWLQLQEQKEKKGCVSAANYQRFGCRQPAVFKLRTDVTEDISRSGAMPSQWSYIKDSLNGHLHSLQVLFLKRCEHLLLMPNFKQPALCDKWVMTRDGILYIQSPKITTHELCFKIEHCCRCYSISQLNTLRVTRDMELHNDKCIPLGKRVACVTIFKIIPPHG